MASIPTKTIAFRALALLGSRGNPSTTAAVVNFVATGQRKVKELMTRIFPLTAFS